MKKIFEKISLGNLELKNRLIRSATFENGAARRGEIKPLLNTIHETLAKGGVGLNISGMMAINATAPIKSDMIRTDLPDFVEKYSEVTNNIHKNGGKIVVQLSHCGVKGTVGEDGYRVGASVYGDKDRELSKNEIGAIVKDFARAAQRCKEAGADGVQIHAAHAYLLSQFLSPIYNKRQDEYGGVIANRARILLEVYDAIREAVGEKYPILIKINYSDLVENGFTGDECYWVCQELDKRKIDAIEVSSGLAMDSNSKPSQPLDKPEGYFSAGALRLAENLNTAIISVGGYRSPKAIENILNRGNITAVALSRALILEPDLPQIWQAGNDKTAECICCNGCFSKRSFGCNLNSLNTCR